MSAREERALAVRLANRRRRHMPRLTWRELSAVGKRQYLAKARRQIAAANKQHERALRRQQLIGKTARLDNFLLGASS